MLDTAAVTPRWRTSQVEVHSSGLKAGCRGTHLLGVLQGRVQWAELVLGHEVRTVRSCVPTKQPVSSGTSSTHPTLDG